MTTNYKPLMMKYILLMNEYDRKRIIYIDLFVLMARNVSSNYESYIVNAIDLSCNLKRILI